MSGRPSIRPTILIVRDGWGENPHAEHQPFNAVYRAATPVDDRLRREFRRTLVRTSGVDVGLPPNVIGNSEVGHQNLGAGRIVDQELRRISRSIEDGRFFENPQLLAACRHVIDSDRSDTTLHLLGLVSRGRVHSDLDHLFALVDLALRNGVPAERVVIHVLTDGRDTGPRTGIGFIRELEHKLEQARGVRIGSVIGRYWAMDRDHRWQRTARAYECLTGRPVTHPDLDRTPPVAAASDAATAVQGYYDQPLDENRTGDEYIPPTRIGSAAGDGRVRDGDAVVFFNFRGDRPRQLTRAFVLDDAAWTDVSGGGFDRGPRLTDLYFCTMTRYEADLPVTAVAFEKPERMPDILGSWVSDAGLTQFRCAETEKFAHVTFFFNDYREAPFPGEHRALIPSPQDVTTYDQRPAMSAAGVCDAVLERLDSADCESLLIVNFANPDMVGHTGNLDAVIEAVEVVDDCVGRIVDAAIERGFAAIVTADHGNAEQMWDPELDCPHTAHTTYDVPLYVIDPDVSGAPALRDDGRLADVAPTVLDLMGLDIPTAMTGRSLIASA